jgi:hypothetical protein
MLPLTSRRRRLHWQRRLGRGVIVAVAPEVTLRSLECRRQNAVHIGLADAKGGKQRGAFVPAREKVRIPLVHVVLQDHGQQLVASLKAFAGSGAVTER